MSLLTTIFCEKILFYPEIIWLFQRGCERTVGRGAREVRDHAKEMNSEITSTGDVNILIGGINTELPVIVDGLLGSKWLIKSQTHHKYIFIGSVWQQFSNHTHKNKK